MVYVMTNPPRSSTPPGLRTMVGYSLDPDPAEDLYAHHGRPEVVECSSDSTLSLSLSLSPSLVPVTNSYTAYPPPSTAFAPMPSLYSRPSTYHRVKCLVMQVLGSVIDIHYLQR